MELALQPGMLEAFGLHAARAAALVVGAPLLGSGTGFSAYKVALIMGLALLLHGTHGEPLAHQPGAIEYGVLMLREVVIGLALAFTLHIVLLAVRVAGEMVGHEMGFNMASIVDPATGVNTPVVTQLWEIFFYLGLLAVDGHHLLLRGLDASFDRAPVGEVTFAQDMHLLAGDMFVQMFEAGLVFAAPMLVLLFTLSVLMGVLARLVPQLNVNELGFTARVAVGLVALLAFVPLLAPALSRLYEGIDVGIGRTLDALGG
jgi:flagellar biosynthetic protein FliR